MKSTEAQAAAQNEAHADETPPAIATPCADARVGARLLPFAAFTSLLPAAIRCRNELAIRQGCGEMLREEINHGRYFLFAPVWMGLGAILWFSAASDPPPVLLFSSLVIVAPFAWYTRHAANIAALLSMIVMLALCGALFAQAESWRRQTVMLNSPVTVTITGRVDRREATGENRWRYQLHVIATESPTLKRPPSRISVTMRGQDKPFETGMILKGRARLSPPSGPAHPGLHDFGFSAYFDGIGAHGFFMGKPEIRTDIAAPPSIAGKIETWLFSVRARIGDRIRATVPGDAGAFAAALVTDERRAISRETTEALRLSGLAHIIAISGLNMALAAGIFFVGLRTVLSLSAGLAQRYPIKKFAAAGALVTACAYYLISGFAVSAERAFLMMAILLIAVLVDRPSISLRNIALSAFVIMAMTPSEILGPSFQMSFAATLALVAGYELWQRHTTARQRGKPSGMSPLAGTGRLIAGVFMTSLIGGLSTAVFSIEHFHKLATYGLAANLAAMPVISFVIMPAGLVAMLLMPLGLDALPLTIMGWGLDIVILIAKAVAGWGGEVTFGRQPPLFLPLSVIGMILLLLLRTRLRYTGIAFLITAVIIASATPSARPGLLVSEDGRLVALADGTSLNSNRGKPERFLFEQWQRALAIPDHQPPVYLTSAFPAGKPQNRGDRKPLSPEELSESRTLLRSTRETALTRRFACVKGKWCYLPLPQASVITLEDGRYIGFACDNARLVITQTRSKVARCRSGAIVLDLATLRRTGSLDIRLTDNPGHPFLLRPSYREAARPWAINRAYSWRSDDYTADIPPEIALLLSDNGE